MLLKHIHTYNRGSKKTHTHTHRCTYRCSAVGSCLCCCFIQIFHRSKTI